MSSSSSSENESNSSMVVLSSQPWYCGSAKQHRLRLETERIAQFELNQSSDTFFTSHYTHLIRYKSLLKKQRLKEGEKNNDGLYIFYQNFGRSHRFIRGLIYQEYNGHYYRINRGTKIINVIVTFPSTVQQVSETIKGKIYYKGRPVVLPEPEFVNDFALVIITNLSEISSLPTTPPKPIPPNYLSLDPAVESLLLLSKPTTKLPTVKE